MTSKRYPDFIKQVIRNLRQGTYDVTADAAREITDAVFKSFNDLLQKDGVDKLITPIGVFSLYTRQSYQGKHPKTGEVIEVPPKTLVKYRPSTEVNRALAQRYDVSINENILYSVKKKKGA